MVNTLVATMRTEAVEERFESFGVFDEVCVVGAEEAHAGVERQGNGNDAGTGELLPQGGGAVEAADAVGFGFGEDGFCGIELTEALPESGFEKFLTRLFGFGGEAEEGTTVLGEVFEVENLSSFSGESGEEMGFADAGETAEDDELELGEEGFEIGDQKASPVLVAAIEDANAPADVAQDGGYGVGAHAAAPAIYEGGVVAVFL